MTRAAAILAVLALAGCAGGPMDTHSEISIVAEEGSTVILAPAFGGGDDYGSSSRLGALLGRVVAP